MALITKDMPKEHKEAIKDYEKAVERSKTVGIVLAFLIVGLAPICIFTNKTLPSEQDLAWTFLIFVLSLILGFMLPPIFVQHSKLASNVKKYKRDYENGYLTSSVLQPYLPTPQWLDYANELLRRTKVKKIVSRILVVPIILVAILVFAILCSVVPFSLVFIIEIGLAVVSWLTIFNCLKCSAEVELLEDYINKQVFVESCPTCSCTLAVPLADKSQFTELNKEMFFSCPNCNSYISSEDLAYRLKVWDNGNNLVNNWVKKRGVS